MNGSKHVDLENRKNYGSESCLLFRIRLVITSCKNFLNFTNFSCGCAIFCLACFHKTLCLPESAHTMYFMFISLWVSSEFIFYSDFFSFIFEFPVSLTVPSIWWTLSLWLWSNVVPMVKMRDIFGRIISKQLINFYITEIILFQDSFSF